jgi:hypothetical protein
MDCRINFCELSIVRASPLKRMWLGTIAIALFLASIWSIDAMMARTAPKDPGFGLDFIAFYAAGDFVREHRTGDLYNLDAVHQFQLKLASANHFDIGRAYGPWWNPPFYALVFAPLSALPYFTAAGVWIGFNLLCFAGACVLLWRMLPQRLDWRARALVPVLAILSAPFILAVSHAQNTCTSLLLLTITVCLWRSSRAMLAGLVGGLMFYKPQVAAVLAIVLVLDLGWRALIGYAITGVSLLTANLILLPGTLGDYLHRLPANVHSFQTGTLYPWEQHVTLKAFWRLLLQGHSLGDANHLVTLLTASTALIIGGWLMIAAIRTGRSVEKIASELDLENTRRRDRLIAATIVAAPLLMPFYFDYDLLLLFVPAVLFASDLAVDRERSMTLSDRWTIVAWCGLYVWQMANSEVGGKTSVNLSVPILWATARLMIGRVTRVEDSATETHQRLLVPSPSGSGLG